MRRVSKLRFVMLYIGGKVPEERRKETAGKWREWDMNEKLGVEVAQGMNVQSSGSSKSQLDLRGVSVIEAESMEDAVRIAEGCPSMPYGMRVEVFQEAIH